MQTLNYTFLSSATHARHTHTATSTVTYSNPSHQPINTTHEHTGMNPLPHLKVPTASQAYNTQTHTAYLDEQHRCMGLNSHGFSKVSMRDAAGVKQVSTSV